MSRMFPPDLGDNHDPGGESGPTDGERHVFRFLRQATRSSNDITIWFEPRIGNQRRRPDFVLFHKKHGLVVIEVKDWSIQQIARIDPSGVTLHDESGPQRTHPEEQARSYGLEIQDLQRELRIVNKDGAYRGKPKIPVIHVLAFPNLTLADHNEHRLEAVFPTSRTLLREDIHASGDLASDPTGGKLMARIEGLFPFPCADLSGAEIAKLQDAFWPSRDIRLPTREGDGKEHFQAEVSYLDDAQERIARRLKRGHQIVKGPPGSGKTLILVERCRHLHLYDSRVKRILLVCFNIALASYLRRLVLEHGIGTGESSVEVLHFYELCSKVLGENVRYSDESTGYFTDVHSMTLDSIDEGLSQVAPYDAILVDEGQDFNQTMYKCLVGLLEPEGDLVITLDTEQDIYHRIGSWKALGIQASGRVKTLARVYRNTSEIYEFSRRFLGDEPDGAHELTLFPEVRAFHGDPPRLIGFESAEALLVGIADNIAKKVQDGAYKRSEIAVIYNDKEFGVEHGPDHFSYGGRTIPTRFKSGLESRGIPVKWVSEDVRAKELFDITSDSVSLVSIHSAKGIDFDLVYLCGVDAIEPSPDLAEELAGLIYVGITRAKHHLVIPYVKRTLFIQRMEASLLPRK